MPTRRSSDLAWQSLTSWGHEKKSLCPTWIMKPTLPPGWHCRAEEQRSGGGRHAKTGHSTWEIWNLSLVREPVLWRARWRPTRWAQSSTRSEEHTSELQSLRHLVCRLL